jgi:uncharacterized repeat protein (TIGR01451 family)/fimbrial isopeptide formation D2 family protein
MNRTFNGAAQAPGSISFAITDPDNAMFSGYPQRSTAYNGGLSPTQNALALATDYGSSDTIRTVTTTIDFSGYDNGITNVSFSIFDIDFGFNSWRDEIIVTATDLSGNTLNPSSITNLGFRVQQTSPNTVEGIGGNVTSGSGGNATFNFNQSGITQITIVYGNTIGVSNPGSQVIALHDINYSYLVPDLSTSTKSVLDVNGGDVNPGDVLRYTISLNNTGDASYNTVSVTDNVPPNVQNFNVVSVPTGATNSSTGAGTGANNTGFVNVSNISVSGGGSESVVFEVTVRDDAPLNATIPNSASIVATGGTGATATAPTLTVLRQSDIAITKTDGAVNYTPGGTATYTLTVTNNGPHNAYAITVSDVLPAGVTINGSWICNPATPPGDNTASCITGQLPGTTASGSGNINQQVDIPSGKSLVFTVPVQFASTPAPY